MQIHLGYLYPHTMNTYGDVGNIICLQQRCAWRDITLTIHNIELGTPIPAHLDCYFFGGGQDAAQIAVAQDLHSKKDRLYQDIERGVPCLAICGGYQLLGEAYQPSEGESIAGLGIFPVHTTASSERLIGNVILEANPILKVPASSTLVGFENHSGKTHFTRPNVQPLGTVRKGSGNNGKDATEGCVVYHAIGSYLHGPLLPKNPHLADWLLEKAIHLTHPHFRLSPLEDALEWQAHTEILERYG